ncbi:MAG: hypothetical protein JST67_04150 [Bacteroidetes bacterium]|nr:hypothetical protein [Bacteroidota bacterium]
MKSTLFLLWCVYLSFAQIKAQDSLCFNKKYVAKNNVTAEVFGFAYLYSLNYERNFCIKENIFHNFRAGLSYCILPNKGMGVYIPLGYSFNLGKKRNKFFLGTGATLMIATNPYPTSAAGRSYARQYADTAKTSWGQPFTDVYVPLFDLMFHPVYMGYQYTSKKRLYLKVEITTLLIDMRPIRQQYILSGWAGVTFGFKLNKMK